MNLYSDKSLCKLDFCLGFRVLVAPTRLVLKTRICHIPPRPPFPCQQPILVFSGARPQFLGSEILIGPCISFSQMLVKGINHFSKHFSFVRYSFMPIIEMNHLNANLQSTQHVSKVKGTLWCTNL